MADASRGRIKQSFASCVSAASKLGGSIDALVCGRDVDEAARAASLVSNLRRVLKADHEALDHHLAEPMAALVTKVMERYLSLQVVIASILFLDFCRGLSHL